MNSSPSIHMLSTVSGWSSATDQAERTVPAVVLGKLPPDLSHPTTTGDPPETAMIQRGLVFHNGAEQG